MRICLLCYRGNPYSGGQGIYLKYVAEELSRQGHEVHVLAGPPYPVLDKKIKMHPIPNDEYFIKKKLSIVNKNNPFDIFNPINFYEYTSSRFGVFPEIKSFSLRAFLKLRELTRNTRFDVIHDNQCLGYGLLLIKTLGIPTIATIHHPLTIDRDTIVPRATNITGAFKTVMFYPVLMQKIVSKRLDHVIAVSENTKKDNHRYFGVPLEKQTVIYNGIDFSIFKPVRNIKKQNHKILFVGNAADSKKGFSYLVKAMKYTNTKIKLTVVDGISLNNKGINRFIKKMGVSNRIEFTGSVSTKELAKHYNEAMLTIVPSIYEGFGFPAAESMACGTPVIAAEGGALPEVVGNAGIIIPTRNSEKLADAINAAFTDRALLKRMSKLGIARARTLFSWKTAVKKIVELYSDLVK